MKYNIPEELLSRAVDVDIEIVHVPDGVPILKVTLNYIDGSWIALEIDTGDGSMIAVMTPTMTVATHGLVI